MRRATVRRAAVSDGDTRSRSSVSAERLISQAKAGEPAQKTKKMKATKAPVELAGDRDGEAANAMMTAPYIMP